MSAPIRLHFGQFTIIPTQRLLLREGRPVPLGSRAFDLLTILAEEGGSVVSKDSLMQRVWSGAFVEEGSLRVHMAMLRKALREGGDDDHITNIPRRGYCLTTQVTRRDLLKASLEQASESPGLGPQMPQPPERMIGRENETCLAVQSLLQRRFLTVVGPGGMGKTTVAVATALRLQLRHGMQMLFVDLGGLRRGQPVVGAVAAALGCTRTEGADVIDSLASAAAPFLLVLDNCEHVLDGAAAFAEMLITKIPGAHVVATSREPLRARGEWVQRLHPLPLPPLDAALTYADALAFASFELFVERSAASVAQILYGDAEVSAISNICRRLDGSPLAIELVAAQVGFYGLAGLLAQLETACHMPTVGWRTAARRHQSLPDSLRWSFDLLSPQEQSVFSRLSVFSESFTLDAAAAIACGEDDSRQTSRALMSLVSKSLIWADDVGGETRFRMCEATRAFAARQHSAA